MRIGDRCELAAELAERYWILGLSLPSGRGENCPGVGLGRTSGLSLGHVSGSATGVGTGLAHQHRRSKTKDPLFI